jgi:16S rRNA (uracil1498-N3)-methyltransferase
VRRFFVEEIVEKDGAFSIKGSEARHMSKVLRMGPGDRIILFDRKGNHFVASIRSITPHEVDVLLKGPAPRPSPTPVEIILCQALIRSSQMDYMIQKTSELGVARIFPFTSERTIVRPLKERLGNRLRHWREIAASSAKQCRRIAPAEIEGPKSFRDLIIWFNEVEGAKIILWEEKGGEDLKGLLRESQPPRTFVGVVGPEGGFSREEISIARDGGFIPASLGSRILRSETAASTLVAIVQYEWGDLSLDEKERD